MRTGWLNKYGSVALLWMTSISMAEPAPSPQTLEQLNEAMQTRMAEQNVPSVSYAIFNQQGLIHSQALGVKDRQSATPATTTTLYRAGSVTKTLTAIAIMQLIEQGYFDLQTPVHTLVRDLPIVNPYHETHPVRIVHLLEHSAGFDDMHFKGIYRDDELLNAHATALQVDPEPLQVRWPPGAMFSYSNPGYGVLGAVIEQISGQRWEDYVQANIVTPLGMKHSVLTIAEALERDHALPYQQDEHSAAMSAIYLRAAGVLWTTPEDLSVLARFLASDGATVPGLLSVPSIRRIKQPHSTLAAKAGLDFGYALGVYHSVLNGRHFIGHNGGITGFFASYGFDPASGIGYATLHNSDQVGGAFARLISDYLNHAYPQPPKALPIATPSPALEGWYRLANSRNELIRLPEWLFGVTHWRNVGEKVVLNPLVNEPIELVVSAEQRLAEADDPVWTGQIIADGDKLAGFSLDGQFFRPVSAFSALAPPVLLLLAFVGLLSAPFGRRKALQARSLRRWPTLAAVSLLAMFGLTFNLSLQTVAQINLTTFGIFLASLLLPLAVIGGWVSIARYWSTETAAVAKWRCLIGIVSATYITFLFANFHWIGLALWAW